MTSSHLRSARLAALLATLAVSSTAATAASFDCGAARSPVEQAICGDAPLSALDSQLADAYRAALKRQGDNADWLKGTQRQWLKSRVTAGKPDIAALRETYRDRIHELQDLPAFPLPDQPVEGPTFRLTKAAKQHDFVLRMLNACPASKDDNDATCEGAGQLLVYDKGQQKLLQAINLPNVFVTLPAHGGGPLVNSAALYDYQGVLNVDDFNFDGHEDFGVQNGNKGSYGGPSYDIYLFDAKTGRFVYNNGMSELILETLGFFDVDAEHKQLETLAKSGCCYHEATRYRVVNDVPVAVERHIEQVLSGNPNGLDVTDEKLVNGKWVSRTHHEPLPK